MPPAAETKSRKPSNGSIFDQPETHTRSPDPNRNGTPKEESPAVALPPCSSRGPSRVAKGFNLEEFAESLRMACMPKGPFSRSPANPQSSSGQFGPMPQPIERAPVLQVNGSFIREGVAASLLHSILSPVLGDAVTPGDVQTLRQAAVAECQEPGDLIETWLLEELMVLQYASMSLHARSAHAGDSRQIGAYSKAACHVTAEMRRVIATLCAYRQTRGPRKSRLESPEGPPSEPATGEITSQNGSDRPGP